MKRQILVFLGLCVLFLLFGFSSNSLAAHYKVKKGDSLYSISKKFNISVNEIKKSNNLRNSKIKINQVLKITPKGSSKLITVEKHDSSSYTVKKGDTLSEIAQKNRIPLKKLMALNNLNSKTIRAGQKIVFAKSITPHQKKNSFSEYYTVKKGDTLSEIAQKNRIPLKKLMALNNLNSKTIRAGQKIVFAKSTIQPWKQPDSSENQDEDIAEDTTENVEESPDDEEGFFSNIFSFIGKEEFLGKWKSRGEMQKLIKKATAFLGAPYRLGGTSKRGIDCSAFVQKVYRNFHVYLPRVARDQSEVGVEVDIDKLAKGDLVFFNTNRSLGHVGIYIGNNKFIHASSRNRRVRIDSLNHPYYQERFERAVRIKELPLGG